MLADLILQINAWALHLVDTLGWPGVVFLMFLESSFLPYPSELVMPQAGYLVYAGRMNMVEVIAAGIAGSWLGALLNYSLAKFLGRPFFLRFGKYFFCSPSKFERAERFFSKHGEISTFTGRLIPVVRHLISIPAGLARMNMARFLLYTGLGAGLWVTVLACIGYFVGQEKERWKELVHEWTWFAVAFSAVLIAVYVLYQRRKRNIGREVGRA
jgi:membrane protein DedA with SNARE-associated domain